MLAASAEYEATLPPLARRLTAALADLCMVDVVAPEGSTVRVAAALRDPALRERAAELRRFPPDFQSPRDPIGRAGSTGESLLVGDVAEEWLTGEVEPREYRELLRSLRLRSALVAPLIADGATLGAITLASADPSRSYGADELALAEDLAGRIAGAVAHAHLRRRTDGVAQAETEFLAAMSHEFRTPVHIISMFSELLLIGVPEPVPSGARKHVEQIQTAAKHLDGLVDQVLTFTRLEADREVVRREAVDVAALARDTAALIEPLALQKGLRFQVELPHGSVVADTDPNKLRQVLFNLLGNAVKFTASGEVRLIVRPEAERVVLEVHDTGPGIAPEHRERIFEPFWQADRSATEGSKGTGLGLGIVRHLVGLLGGEIGVQSGAGAGSVFRVTIPKRFEPA